MSYLAIKLGLNLFLGTLFLLIVSSCSQSRLKKYESDWIVTKYDINGDNFIDNVRMHNFLIDIKHGITSPPSLHDQSKDLRGKSSSVMFMTSEGGKDYIDIRDHPYFGGKYEIKCLDKQCCTISLSNDSIYIEMDYNGPYFHGKPRDCPKPRFGSNQE